jgi:predicted O-methyltransferase YrrM
MEEKINYINKDNTDKIINIKDNSQMKLKRKFKLHVNIIILIILILTIFLFNYGFKPKIDIKEDIYFDQFEPYIYKEIKDKLIKTKCSIMWDNQREFINGIVRKIRPKNIIELGVNFGGSSIIILNAIKDMKNSHLYSIDTRSGPTIGSCVYNNFTYLTDKWTLLKGGIASDFTDKIPINIDFAMLDTSHFEPGEILDFLLILPFLKEEAWVLFHDIDHQITYAKGKNMRYEWAPYLIFNLIRGQKFLPSGKGIFNKDIGAIKLEKNQKRYIHDYCRALGSQWEYFPSENHIQSAINFFEKYYDDKCINMLKEAVEFNREFVRDNPKKSFNYFPFLSKHKNYLK